MILEQFHRTQFALPTMSIEPPDGRTVVNLPVFYELIWPEAGFEPDEVDTTEIVGHEVRIRPTLDSANYHFGDGSSSGPTGFLGGPHPAATSPTSTPLPPRWSPTSPSSTAERSASMAAPGRRSQALPPLMVR